MAQPFFDRRVKCAVNPVLAREAGLADALRSPASEKKRVLVVGGGPSGMEAARVAAERGHEVVLCEKSSQLGGTLRIAALSYEPNESLLRWLEARVRALPIDVRLDTDADEATIREIAPDVVLAALGATRERPTIPGADAPHVMDGDDLRRLLTGEPGAPALPVLARAAVGIGRALGLTRDPARLRAASRLYMPVGRRVAVVGGGLVGIELAEFLAARGREITVLEEGPVMALEMAHPRRWRVLHELREAGVRLVEGARVLAIDGTTVRFETKDAQGEAPADTVVIATGLQGNPLGIARLEAAGVPVVAIGDGRGVSYIEGAIHEGFHAALAL